MHRHLRVVALAGIAAAAFALPGSLASAATANVTLAPATPGAVRFTVSVPAPQMTVIDQADHATRMQLDGFAPEGMPGAPGLPMRVVTVAVPPLGPVHVRAVATDRVTFDGTLLEPQAAYDADGTARAVRRSEAYGAAGSAEPDAATLLEVTWMRNQRIARIAIRPAAYQPAARRLTVARRIDVEVSVQPVSDLGPPAEADDPFEPVYRGALANYEQGRAWRRPETRAYAAAARRLGVTPDAALAATVLDSSLYVGHEWVKISVSHPGFYAVDYSSLRQLQIFSPDRKDSLKSLRLFTLPGYPLLPETSFCDDCEYKEVAIGIVDASPPSSPTTGGPDGLFSYNGDYFYFFAQGPSGWANDYDPSLPDTLYLNHPYDKHNDYYLMVEQPGTADTIGGTPARIDASQVADLGGAGTPVATFPERLHFEQDIEYWPDASARHSTLFWEKWMWISLKTGDTFTTTFDAPGADTTQPARFRLRSWGLTDNFFSGNCVANAIDHFMDLTVNASDPASRLIVPRRAWRSFVAWRGGQTTIDTSAAFLHTSGNALSLNIPAVSTNDCPGRVDRSALAWFDVAYPRRFEPVHDSLVFRTPQGAGTFHFDIGPFSRAAPPRLFDITDPLTPREIRVPAQAMTAVGQGWQLAFDASQTESRRFAVFPDSLISIARIATSDLANAPLTSLNDNLRSHTNAADYIVIYYDGFRAAADTLAEARRSRLPLAETSPPFQTKSIPISAIYDQFSGGRTDASAVRNFLRAAFYNWTKRPRFVTFLGDASYDFKDIKGRAPAGQPGCLLPTYENGYDESFQVMRQFATDDWMLNVDDPNSFVPEFYGGRIPADDAQTALDVVRKKQLLYERSAPLGEYRNKVMLIADDNIQGDKCDQLGWVHINQTDSLNVHHTPWHMDRVYVYLNTYATGAGSTKPGARADIKQNLNDGVAMFNYVGHGSPFKISDESVMIDSDVGSLTNGARMPLFVAASCDVGKFNDPTVQSLGERLVMSSTNGAIGVISATEQAFSGDNAVMNRYLYDQIFARGDARVGGDTLRGTGQYHVPVAAALLSAKINSIGSSEINNAKYQLMGDAAFQLNLPRLWADVALTDLAGAPVTQLQRGQTVQFRGRVLDQPGGTALPFEGVASLLIEDSWPTLYTGNSTECLTSQQGYNYRYKAGPMYHGDVSIASGGFDGRFVVPMDATLGDSARVRVYFQGQSDRAGLDGAGAQAIPLVPGTPNLADTQGPRITLSFVGGSTAVRADATMRIDLFDESGIMTTGHALQNSIVVTVDDNTTSRVDVTSTFRYAADSYQSGTANFTLPNLSSGHHRIKVSAADNLATGLSAGQHRSTATIEFDVVDKPTLSITQAYLFPNPAHSKGAGAGGSFVIDAPGDSLNTLIRVYTISGRLIRTLTQFGGLGQVQIPWDGRDAEGDPLANGTYLFRVFVYNRDSDGSSSPREKAVTDGRIVIVNR